MSQATYKYDTSNIFARILRGEIPCKKVFENEYVLAFYDIAPNAPIHVLVIPKRAYTCFDDFSSRASAEEIGAFFKAVGEVARLVKAPEQGFRLIANTGLHGGQEVPHFHVHILAGKPLGPMVSSSH